MSMWCGAPMMNRRELINKNSLPQLQAAASCALTVNTAL
eukprot:CAMPEP_0173114698 /NCGR_PEP_ID=MMETSP1102-20130122/47857_1 /TAXON_ID=49646 /ORGANISM="Geminigera sp., Strain Caron Lab Isolate" /LENGTH=38 /DNA_ID= /DNA_START= /DNA_END= /DNA_ORIENTATION=